MSTRTDNDLPGVYRQRNNLAIAFCKVALAAGWKAGRGIDDSKDPTDRWKHVVYVDLPGGQQVSWHIAPSEVHLLKDLPTYDGKWDGNFLARDKHWPNLIPQQYQLDIKTATGEWLDKIAQFPPRPDGMTDADFRAYLINKLGDER